MVWAQARGGGLGLDGGLPWHLPEDLALFRALTLGSTVVMGRRTWESLPSRVRPLPGRSNVVLTSRPNWSADGASVARSVEEVVRSAADIWVIGGASVYTAFLPHASEVVVTDIDASIACDTFAPVLGAGWIRTSREPAEGWSTSTSGLPYAVSRFVPLSSRSQDPGAGG